MRPVTVYVPGADPARCWPPTCRTSRAPGGAIQPTGRRPAGSSPAGRTRRCGQPNRWTCSWRRRPVTRPLITFLLLHGHVRPGYGSAGTQVLQPVAGTGRSALGPDLTVSSTPRRNWVSASGTGSPPLPRPPPGCSSSQAGPGRAHDGRPGRVRDRVPGEAERAVKAGTLPDGTAACAPGAVPPADPGRLPELAGPRGLADRLAGITPPVRDALIAYLELKKATCTPKTVSSLATRLMHFGRFLTLADPGLSTLSGLDRQRHIEPYLAFLADAPNSKKDAVITIGEQQRRILAVGNFLTDITEWGWDDAPSGGRSSAAMPRGCPGSCRVTCPSTLTAASPPRCASQATSWPPAALLLQRACGLRIGELLDLELDCAHEVPGSGAWLKVPLGKLDTERMVPLDSETVDLVDPITAIRSPGRPLPHPRYRPARPVPVHPPRAAAVPERRPRGA